ncbi:hypothetical protein GCM10027030_16740 [Luteococcus sediminum]
MHRLWTTASIAASTRPGMVPQGANDFSCRPRPGENPVVLVPGTGEDTFANWSWMSSMLSRDGWCVYTFTHNPSTGPAGRLQESSAFSGDIRSSAAVLAWWTPSGSAPAPRRWTWWATHRVADRYRGPT